MKNKYLPRILNAVAEQSILTISVSSTSLLQTTTSILSGLNHKYEGICLLFNFNADLLIKYLPKKKFKIIDASGNKCISPNCQIIPINALTEISIALGLSLTSEKFEVVVVSGPATLLAYHDTALVKQFLRYILNMANSAHAAVILITTNNSSPANQEINDFISQHSIKTIKA